MTRTVRMPDLAEQIEEIVGDPNAYVRRSREVARDNAELRRGKRA